MQGKMMMFNFWISRVKLRRVGLCVLRSIGYATQPNEETMVLYGSEPCGIDRNIVTHHQPLYLLRSHLLLVELSSYSFYFFSFLSFPFFFQSSHVNCRIVWAIGNISIGMHTGKARLASTRPSTCYMAQPCCAERLRSLFGI